VSRGKTRGKKLKNRKILKKKKTVNRQKVKAPNKPSVTAKGEVHVDKGENYRTERLLGEKRDLGKKRLIEEKGKKH